MDNESATLDAIDLETMTLDDVKKMKNPVLREAIHGILERRISPAAHHNHVSHTDHGKEIAPSPEKKAFRKPTPPSRDTKE